jgi:hypothetical protein
MPREITGFRQVEFRSLQVVCCTLIQPQLLNIATLLLTRYQPCNSYTNCAQADQVLRIQNLGIYFCSLSKTRSEL